jgi:hypothetical protein
MDEKRIDATLACLNDELNGTYLYDALVLVARKLVSRDLPLHGSRGTQVGDELVEQYSNLFIIFPHPT